MAPKQKLSLCCHFAMVNIHNTIRTVTKRQCNNYTKNNQKEKEKGKEKEKEKEKEEEEEECKIKI